jgi:hypothetical protein
MDSNGAIVRMLPKARRIVYKLGTSCAARRGAARPPLPLIRDDASRPD